MRPSAKQPTHLNRRLQIALRIRLQQKPRFINGHRLSNAGHHILQRTAVRRMVQHIIGGQNAQATGLGNTIQPRNPRHIITAIQISRPDVPHLRQGLAQPGQASLKHLQIGGRHHNQMQTLTILCHHLQRQMSLTFLLPPPLDVDHLAFAQQHRQPRISGVIPRIGQQLRTTHQHQPRPDQRAHLGLPGLSMNTHHPGQGIVIRNAHRVIALQIGACRQIHRIRGRPQK